MKREQPSRGQSVEPVRAPHRSHPQSNRGDAEILDRLFSPPSADGPTEAERPRLLSILADSGRRPSDTKAIAAARRPAAEDLFSATLTGRIRLFDH